MLELPVEEPARPRTRPAGGALLGRGFRPFFLLAGLHAAVVVPVWVAVWRGVLPSPGWLSPPLWHAHEMLFGTVSAAIAGFLLTSVPVWTGGRAVAGPGLAGLVAAWLAGRLAMAAAGALPHGEVAVVDLAFLPLLAGALARSLVPARQPRNLGFLVVLVALAGLNGVVHADALGLAPGRASGALRIAVDLVVVLVVVVGGRITPAFTRNALLRAGVEAEVRARPWLDRLAVASVVAVAVGDALVPRTPWSGGLALVAAVSVAARASGWQTRRVLRDPLLWSLHAGTAWVALGLALVAVADFTGALPASAGLHALTAGAMGSMILAVMTRVGLGHTGRPLVAPRGIPTAYGAVHLAAAARVGAAVAPQLHAPLLVVSAASWALAFGVFVVVYAPILLSPRVDGRPG